MKDSLKIFGISDISKADLKSVKVTYRKLMMRNHPDRGGSEEAAKYVTNAYNKIVDYIEKREKEQEIAVENEVMSVLLDDKDYYSILNGGSVKVRNSLGVEKIICRQTLDKFNVLVKVKIQIKVDDEHGCRGCTVEKTSIPSYNYDIDLEDVEYADDYKVGSAKISISILGQVYEVNTAASSIKAKVSLQGLNIALNLRRVQRE